MEGSGFSRRFARAVAHDLRSPLDKVVGFAEALGEDLEGKLEGADARHLAFLVDCAREARERVERLSAWGRLEADDAVQRVDLASVVEAELPKGLALEGAWPTVRGSRAQLTTLVRELLANAAAYGGGAASLTVEGEVLGVRDAGGGVPPEHRERVLEPLVRLVAPREHPGAGLGLAICARIVELHGGRLWIEDAGGSAHVRFSLPEAILPA